MHVKKENVKSNKDMGKWCDHHKIHWHNDDEYCTRQSLLLKLKALGSNSTLMPHDSMDKGKYTINVEPNVSITTTKVQPEEPKEYEYLFDS
jgi:hypothetical protein